jgi:hypothetical protein
MAKKRTVGEEILDAADKRLVPLLETAMVAAGVASPHIAAAGTVYKLVVTAARICSALSEKRLKMVRREMVDLPPIAQEIHPDEIRMFFAPRPWYTKAFRRELKDPGNNKRILITAMLALPAGLPANKGGLGYLEGKWKANLLMQRLFQQEWENGEYATIVAMSMALDLDEFSPDGLGSRLSPFVQAQFQISAAKLDAFNEEFTRAVIRKIENCSLWDDEEFFADLSGRLSAKQVKLPGEPRATGGRKKR